MLKLKNWPIKPTFLNKIANFSSQEHGRIFKNFWLKFETPYKIYTSKHKSADSVIAENFALGLNKLDHPILF